MNQYKWTHEYQVRKKGIYEVRYMSFRGKMFFYNEALTNKEFSSPIENLLFDNLFELFYNSYLPHNKFDTSYTHDKGFFTRIATKSIKNSYIWKYIKKCSSWYGGVYTVPFNKELK